ncbi:MAG: hypothetical protein FJ161_03480, partial [Gammaproteobacteria bacterium]|nr:hypothetical protein [Gammaproteobacteria bacterium]
MLIGQYHQTLMSPIEYLSLESQYHPSWLMRIFFKRLFRSFAKGQSLHELSLKYGCNFSLKEIELSDLNHIIQTLSTNHPVAFPYPLIWKWIVLLIAQYYICESILYSFEYMMFHMI